MHGIELIMAIRATEGIPLTLLLILFGAILDDFTSDSEILEEVLALASSDS